MSDNCVLIYEDDEGITEIIRLVLEGKGYHVITQSNSTNIYSKIEEVKPDLILLDLWMPGLSGEEITRQLKADASTEHLPVIIISANKDAEKIASNAGATAFLAKPFDISALEDIVDEHILKPGGNGIKVVSGDRTEEGMKFI